METYSPALLRPAAAGVFWALWLAVVGCAAWPRVLGAPLGSSDGVAEAPARGARLATVAMVASIVAGSALATAATARIRAAGLDDGWIWYGAGLGLVSIGLVVRTWSMRSASFAGLYRLVRHPAHTGTLLALAGFGIALDNIVALLAIVVVPLPAIAYRVSVDERADPAPGTVRYAQRRARLIPGVW